jgi:hypothetical protein
MMVEDSFSLPRGDIQHNQFFIVNQFAVGIDFEDRGHERVAVMREY